MGMTNEEKHKLLDAVIEATGDNMMGGKYRKAYESGVINAYNRLVKAIKELEQQPNRCDSCIHSEEWDGSNCYECVKGMGDNFEAQSTDKCKGCYYNDGETHAECVVCDKGAQPTDVDCISRSELLRHQHIIYDDDGEDYRAVYVKDIKAMPPVTPERPKGEWIEYEVDVAPHPLHCSLCGFSNHHISNRYMREFRRCPNCGAYMKEDSE